jgi:hypothetical protein
VRLLLLAEGGEKSQVLQALSAVRGRPVDEVEATQEAKRVVEEDKFLQKSADLPDLLERGRFASLARAIMTNEEWCVDESLNRILALWIESAHHTWAHRCFADAARFLEVAIITGEAKMNESPAPPLKQSPSDRGAAYRVTLPLDFGDGVLHAPGETVLLDMYTAKKFSTGLLRIEQSSEASVDTKKKLA